MEHLTSIYKSRNFIYGLESKGDSGSERSTKVEILYMD